jgi:membrane-associated phospholipid phosphatase
MAANRFVKSSLHVAFAAFCASSLALPAAATIACGLAVIAIGWSRLVLKRHTPIEVGLGAIIGTAAGVGMRLWS